MKKLTLNKETLRALAKDVQEQVAVGMPPASIYYSCEDPCWTEKCRTARYSNCPGVCMF